MKPPLFTALLATSTAVTLAQSNPIFAPTPYPECTTCLDRAVAACGPSGDYDKSEAYAECVCDGAGGAQIVECMSVCNSVDAINGFVVRGGMGMGRVVKGFQGVMIQGSVRLVRVGKTAEDRC